MDEQGQHGGGKTRGGSDLLARLARAKWFRDLFPQSLKRLGRRLLPQDAYQRALWAVEDPYARAEAVSTYPGKAEAVLGILKGFGVGHAHYITACRELGVPYKVVDITGPDWIEAIRDSGCDAFVVWPGNMRTVWKQLYDERLRVIEEDLGKLVYPVAKSVYLYESKRRVHYWLRAHGFPHPRTWVFYNEDEALQFCRTCALPIVFKTDLGAGAKGVRILRQRRALEQFVERYLRRGMVLPDGDRRDRQWGSVLLEEYIPDAAEWRVIRIGESYFAYQKGRRGDFHSGSHIVIFADPPAALLNLARDVTSGGNFTSMSLDIFETPDGRYLINELHPVFGWDPWPHSMEVNGIPGRYVYDDAQAKWGFEEGIFTEHACCSLRIKVVLRALGKPLAP